MGERRGLVVWEPPFLLSDLFLEMKNREYGQCGVSLIVISMSLIKNTTILTGLVGFVHLLDLVLLLLMLTVVGVGLAGVASNGKTGGAGEGKVEGSGTGEGGKARREGDGWKGVSYSEREK